MATNDCIIPSKVCTRCKRELLATTEYFSPSKLGKYGVNSRCKTCLVDIGREKRANAGAVPRVNRKREGEKQCSKCETWYPLTSEHFKPVKHHKDGFSSQCRVCIRTENKEYQQKRRLDPEVIKHEREYDRLRMQNPEIRERKLAQHKEREKRPEVRARRRITDRARLERNPEIRKRKAAHLRELRKDPVWQEYYRNYNHEYFKSEHGKAILAKGDAKRRALVLAAEGEYNVEDVKLQLRSQKYKCWWCDKPLKGVWHIDHRVPLSKGGSNWPNNICITCPHCNLSKSNKLPHEFNGRLL